MSGDGKVVAFSTAESLSSEGAVCAPEDAPPADEYGVKVFSEVMKFHKEYVTWSDDFHVVAAAWTMMTWVQGRFQTMPMLKFTGPMGCGKTRSQDVLKATSHEPEPFTDVAEATIYRTTDKGGKTVFIDEHGKLSARFKAILRNAFGRDSAFVQRCKQDTFGDAVDYSPHKYRTFAAYCLASQEPLDDAALQSRCIEFNMGKVRAAKHIKAYLPAKFGADEKSLRIKLGKWSAAYPKSVDFDSVKLLDGLSLRNQQVFLPLYALVPESEKVHLDAIAKKHLEKVRNSSADTNDSVVAVALIGLGKLPDKDGGIKVYAGEIAKAINQAREADERSPNAIHDRAVATSLKRLGAEPRKHDRGGSPYYLEAEQYADLARAYGDGVTLPGEGVKDGGQ